MNHFRPSAVSGDICRRLRERGPAGPIASMFLLNPEDFINQHEKTTVLEGVALGRGVAEER